LLRCTDGGGLYLEIGDNGRKRWALRLQAHGKRRDFGLGSVTKVTLADARERAAEYRRMVFKGEDPVAHRFV
jgi:Arm DNA-binding domain